MGRPVHECLNCGHKLEEQHNFCPNCGQENRDQRMSMKMLLGDFLSNYFSLDSRLGRSMRHFFFHPGYLTRRFNEGKRVRHVHPLRLYLVITFLFFFILSYIMSLELQESSLQLIAHQDNAEMPEADSLAIANIQEQRHGVKLLPDSEETTTKENLTFQKALQLMRDVSLTDEMVMDSLHIDKANRQDERFQLFLHQSRRVIQKDLDVFIPYVLKNLPVMMFILLPVFALYLRYLFRNKPNLYIGHIIHSLHIHSMVFLLLTLFILVGWFTGHYFFWTTFLLITGYTFLSTKNVYRQPWLRIGWKFLLLGMLYSAPFLCLLFLK